MSLSKNERISSGMPPGSGENPLLRPAPLDMRFSFGGVIDKEAGLYG